VDDEVVNIRKSGRETQPPRPPRRRRSPPSWSSRARTRNHAIKLYQTILKQYPRYERMADVLFYLAFNMDELGQKMNALKVYRKLITAYPDSPFIPDAWLAFGASTTSAKGRWTRRCRPTRTSRTTPRRASTASRPTRWPGASTTRR